MADVVRWRFLDPVLSTDYTVEINPAESDLPGHKRSVKYQNTTGPNGAVLVFLGADAVQQIHLSGTILTQTLFNAWLTWSAKRYAITVVDDLVNTFTVVVDEFSFKRKRATKFPWKGTYTAVLTVLDWHEL